MLAAAALLVQILRCVPSDDLTIVARPTPPAWPVSKYDSYWYDGEEYYNPTILPPQPMLDVEFVNASGQTLREVRFGIYVENELVAEVKDAGRFSPGVHVRHTLKLKSGTTFPPGNARCTVLAAL